MGAPVRIGDVLAEKYQVTRILGVGGMGVVVAARHCELSKLVALKFMHEELSLNEQVTQRFLREARATARLQSEHVVRVLDVGRLPTGVPYIVMEYLEGEDLGQLVEHCGSLEVGDAAEYLLQACEAMAEAHAQGIVHRDLKPQNLFLTRRPDGRPLVKVLDFGISKALFAQGPAVTSQAIGSPSYMAPEQIRSSRSVDTRADIWSLGVILYQLLSNTLPFVGDTVPEVMFKILSQPTPSLALVCSRLPQGLVSTIERCLEKDREHRFANVAELAHDLVPFAPERARAAMSLIERVMTASAPHPRSLTPEREFDQVEPTDAVVTKPLRSFPQSPAQTTLTTAVSSSAIAASSSPPRWRWLVMTTAAMITAISTIVAMQRSAPSASPPSDAPALTPADAGVVTIAVERDASPDEVTQKVAVCNKLVDEAEWSKVNKCASELEDIGVKDKAERLRSRASSEMRHAQDVSKFKQALSEYNLKLAQALLDKLSADSGYSQSLSEKLTRAETSMIEEVKRKAQRFPAARGCEQYVAQQVAKSTNRVISVIRKIGCTQADLPVKAPADSASINTQRGNQPPAGNPTTSGTISVNGQHKLPQGDNCDEKEVDKLMDDATSKFNSEEAKEALAIMSKALRCRQNPAMYQQATKYACYAQDLANARLYFAKIPSTHQSRIEQDCRQQGLNVRSQ